MSENKQRSPANGEQETSAGVRWSEVPESARHDVVWIDGRHGPAAAPLPSIEVEPIPAVLYRLPQLHPARPRGSKPMLDVAGAKARLRTARPGAWLISPLTGWKWAKWPNGEVGWAPSDVQFPDSLRVQTRNDIQ